jgi:integrase
VVELCEAIVTAGKPTQANRVQALISKMFSFAVNKGLVDTHPCYRLEKSAAENVRRRVLTDDEIRLFWHAIVLPPVSRRVGLALRISLLTGARAGEAAGAVRAEIEHLADPARAAWTVPSDRSKNRYQHFVPLSATARATFEEAAALAGPTSFVFPSPVGAANSIKGHALAVAMSRFSESLKGDSGAERSWKAHPPTPHDLRRTFATHLGALGISRELISALLNHAPRGVTAVHYALYDFASDKRRALGSGTRHCSPSWAAVSTLAM